jgi:hypothetical protein
MKLLGSHWTDFHEIWYFIIIRIFCMKKVKQSLYRPGGAQRVPES